MSLDNLRGRTVKSLRRHAKVMFWDLDDGSTLVAHLGMTGKFLFDPQPDPPHTHLRLCLDDGSTITYSDPRRFGWLALYGPNVEPLDAQHYGLDALDADVTDDHIEKLLKSSGAPLKGFLLDQTKIAGLGNIYACEALWRAELSPNRRAKNTPKSKIPKLRAAIVAVLEDSLAAGGTSFSDYVDSIGQKGSFLFDVAVFQREGMECPRCSAEIRRIVQSGRSTFFCPSCQK